MVLELFYSLLHPYYPLKFLTTHGSQSLVFLDELSCLVRIGRGRELHLHSESETQWLTAQKKKDSYKGVGWTENVFFREAVKL